MIDPEVRARIRHYFYAEHWKIGTIAQELSVHPDAVRNAIESQSFNQAQALRASILDPFLAFIREMLEQYPRLRATRIYQMLRERGYTGSVVQLRRVVHRLRPRNREPFLRLTTLPGEQAQLDWAHFGQVQVGRARRALSCLVATRDPLRQSQIRRAGTARKPGAIQSAAAGVERALSLYAAALPGARRKSEGPRGADHPLCA